MRNRPSFGFVGNHVLIVALVLINATSGYALLPDPTPTPIPCSCQCKPFSPTPCPDCHYWPMDDNRSWINLSTGGTIGSAGSNSNCCIDPEDPCAPVVNECQGVSFLTLSKSSVIAYRIAEDSDVWCGASSSIQNYNPAGNNYDGVGPVTSEHSRLKGGTVPIDGIILEAPSTRCGSGGEGDQPVSRGSIHVMDTEVRLTGVPSVEERMGDDDVGFSVGWKCSRFSGDTCAGTGNGLLAYVAVAISTPFGGKALSSTDGDFAKAWSGSVDWDGSFDGGGQWDGMSAVTVTVWICAIHVTTDPFGHVQPGCYCHQDNSTTDSVTVRLQDVCTCDSEVEPCVCEVGSSGGIPRSGGAEPCNQNPSTCSLATRSCGFPFFDYQRDQTVKPFGTANGYAGDRLFKYAKRSSLIANNVEIYEGGKLVESLTPIAQSSETLWHDSQRQIVARTFDVASTTYLEWETGGYLYAFVKPTGSTAQFIVAATNTDTNAVTEYTYGALFTPGHLTTITTGSDVTTVNWDNGNVRMTSVEFPNGASEEFSYTGSTFTGLKQWFNGTLLAYTTWTVNGTTKRIEKFEKRDVNSPYSVLASNDYVYDNNTQQLLSYEKFGQTYSIDRNGANHTKTLTHPDSSSVEYKTLKPEGLTVKTTTIRDATSNTVVKNTVETNVQYGVVTEATDGIGAKTYYIYGFDIDSSTIEDYAVLLHRVTQQEGNYAQYVYNATLAERVSQYTIGEVEKAYTQYDYDVDGRVTKTYTGTLAETSRDYENDLLRVVTDGEGRKSYFEYGGEEQLAGVGNGSATTTFEYDGEDRRTRSEAPSGIRTGYEYHNDTGKLLKVYNDVGSSSAFVTEYQYSIGNYGDDLVAVIDAEARKTGYEYDVWGRLTKENVYDGHGSYTLDDSIVYTYNSTMGEYLDNKVDMNGNKTLYAYYAPGFLKKQTWNQGASTFWGSVDYVYDDAGRVASLTTTGGDCGCGTSSKNYNYTNNGLLDLRTAVHDWYFDYGYDGIGRLNRIDIPGPPSGGWINTVQYIYDAANRVTDVDATVHPALDVTYNKANQVTRLGYAGATPVYKVDNGYDSTTGRLSTITFDGVNRDRKLTYTYNQDGLRTSALPSYKYGTAAMVNRARVNYEYDDLNRLTREYAIGVGPSNCFDFPGGSGDNVTIESGGTLGGALDAIQIDMRIKIDNYPGVGYQAILFERGADGSANWAKLYLDSSGYLKYRVETDAEDESESVGPLPLGVWQHVVASYSATEEDLSLTVNGSGGGKHVTGSFASWGGTPKIGTYFDGQIDEARVQKVANSSLCQPFDAYSADTDTVGLWHFNETSGNAVDSGPDGLDGTVAANIVRNNNNGGSGVGKYDRTYTYDKVGNRKTERLVNKTGSVTSDVTWQMVYNDLNQLTQKHNGTAGDFGSGTERWSYTYDDNGNLLEKKKETKVSVWSQQEKWTYEWNPRDQRTRVVKYTTGANNVGSVEFEYCLSCDGALSKRLEFGAGSGSNPGALASGYRFEYDGLNLLRMDQLYDNDSNGLEENDGWRALWANTYRPGSLGALVGKRVYTYSSGTSGTPSGQNDYTYSYDAVGNVVMVFNANASGQGNESYYFAQDAFGLELSANSGVRVSEKTNLFGSAQWPTARTAGIWEHQTGKWTDPFTGDYYFHARWYDAGVGRFVGRDEANRRILPSDETFSASADCCGANVGHNPSTGIFLIHPVLFNPYLFAVNNPISQIDENGELPHLFGIIIAVHYAIKAVEAAINAYSRCSQCYTYLKETSRHVDRFYHYLTLGVDFNPGYAHALLDELEAALDVCPKAGVALKSAIDKLRKALNEYERIDKY